ncbi:MAG TPA: HAD-IIIC family phosphatase [Spirochaetota bacterium]|nr:HAD family hydrolase [Spirochaetota bacterium]HOD15757.1 HAD-IIIC family phosphatase [Spirochaetota bacterium]HPG51608.1 HAD-IIIC family phosphatase [Spirochaetota bacterium]HPN12693.1 HAD-IIIC family phosphatase [Spirochaetota bacterium]HQL80576.1 HAD-IIIC family phosphatase [Spirochaetota bacterium]
MTDFNQLKKNLKKDFSKFKSARIALLGDSATQLLAQAIRGYGYEVEMSFEIWEADYDQIEMQVFDTSSEVYASKPDYVIIFQSTQKLMKYFYKLPASERAGFADAHLEKVRGMYDTVTSKLKCRVIYFNFAMMDDAVFGNFANKIDFSFTYQLRKINLGLMDLARGLKNLFINDIESLACRYGTDTVNDMSIYVNTDIVFSLDFMPAVAKNIADIILAISGKLKKCAILDLDNTLWGGIIGDDGMENIQLGDLGIGKAFTEFQLWLKELKKRGILLAVCSKNTEEIAREPFEKHPDMVLRMEDISIFVANWDNKADNIRRIQSVLNIGFDSMVFIDDNPVEREMVKTHVPDVTVPDMPEDPAEYAGFLRSLNLFETASFSEEDESRTEQYQQEAKRKIAQEVYTNEDDFLASLNMKAAVSPFNKFNTPRVSQLTQRSNQFNLRTVRYTEDDIAKIAASAEYLNRAFSLKDKFGDYGLISVIILHKREDALFIDTWIMSCRVLKRGMEIFTLNEIVRIAREAGFKKIIGEYLPTPKNGLVKNHYADLGFQSTGGHWLLDVDSYADRVNFIGTEEPVN